MNDLDDHRLDLSLRVSTDGLGIRNCKRTLLATVYGYYKADLWY